MIQGLDTSHHNILNTRQLKEMVQQYRLYFNFMKSTEGVTFQDRKFDDYKEYSHKAGMLCGAYHFFRPFSDAEGQAYNFLQRYTSMNINGMLPPVVDIEWAESAKGEQWSRLSPAKRIKQVRTYLDIVRAAVKTEPIIYTAVNFWETYIYPNCSAEDNKYFAAHPIWIVDLNGKRKVPKPWTKAKFWQTHFGEHGDQKDPYQRLDHDEYDGTVKELLNMTMPGFTLKSGFPRSWIVYDVQFALAMRNYMQDKPDGWFGPRTEVGVKRFQQDNDLPVNGIVDSVIWNALLV